MATQYATVEVVVVVSEDGDYVVAKDDDAAQELFDDEVGGYCRRTVRLTVKVPLPAVIEMAGEAPADEAVGELKVA